MSVSIARPSNQTYVMGSSKFRQDEVTETVSHWLFIFEWSIQIWSGGLPFWFAVWQKL